MERRKYDGGQESHETRPGSDTATFRDLSFLKDYHPDVQQFWRELLEIESNRLIESFRAKYKDKEGILADPDYQDAVFKLRKPLKERCDALQRTYVTTYVTKSETEKRLIELNKREEKVGKREELAETRHKGLDKRVEDVNVRERTVVEREAKYRDLETQYVESKAVLDQGFKDLEAERQAIAKAHAELPELIRTAIAQDKRKAYETAAEIVKKAMLFQTCVQGVLSTAIDASNHESAAAKKVLDDLLYQIKPEEPPKPAEDVPAEPPKPPEPVLEEMPLTPVAPAPGAQPKPTVPADELLQPVEPLPEVTFEEAPKPPEASPASEAPPPAPAEGNA